MKASSVINTSNCSCGERVSLEHRNGPLKTNYDKTFFGGNVEGLFPAQCSNCQADITLLARQSFGSWEILGVALGVNNEQEKVVKHDSFEHMDKQQLTEWLDQRGIPYTKQTGEKRLREICRENS